MPHVLLPVHKKFLYPSAIKIFVRSLYTFIGQNFFGKILYIHVVKNTNTICDEMRFLRYRLLYVKRDSKTYLVIVEKLRKLQFELEYLLHINM